MTRKPKLSDVYWLTVDMRPQTTCEPPEGKTCWLSKGSVHLSAADAKRHAFENVGHYVVRDAVKRSSYILEAES